jgi:flagellar biosynthesis/type III secretory pathway protein FliH
MEEQIEQPRRRYSFDDASLMGVRQEEYNCGYEDGYEDGFKKGYNQACREFEAQLNSIM